MPAVSNRTPAAPTEDSAPPERPRPTRWRVAAIGGRFELVAQLGGGHTGEVYQAHDRETGQPCAVKLVNPAVFPNPLLLQRAERELKQLERLDLVEVARVIAHGRQRDRLWIAMEMVSGVEMMQVVVEGGPIPPLAACRLIRQVAHGLAEAAKQGVIHRDLAAKNVLIGDGESVKIINFPIAVPFSDRVQGVAEFMSPEQVEGKPADQRSSIYSLGALLYFAVTGRPPFGGEIDEVHRAHVGQELVRPSQVTAVPEPVEALIMKAMEKASARRFMTLHQMIGELDSILASGVAAADAMRPAAAVGKARVPVGPAQTLVGVAAFQVQPGGHVPMPDPVIAPVSAQMPAVGPGGPVAPSVPAILDPIHLEPDRPRPIVASGELGGRTAERAPSSLPLVIPPPEPAARPPALIVPTPPAGAPIALSQGSPSSTASARRAKRGVRCRPIPRASSARRCGSRRGSWTRRRQPRPPRRTRVRWRATRRMRFRSRIATSTTGA